MTPQHFVPCAPLPIIWNPRGLLSCHCGPHRQRPHIRSAWCTQPELGRQTHATPCFRRTTTRPAAPEPRACALNLPPTRSRLSKTASGSFTGSTPRSSSNWPPKPGSSLTASRSMTSKSRYIYNFSLERPRSSTAGRPGRRIDRAYMGLDGLLGEGSQSPKPCWYSRQTVGEAWRCRSQSRTSCLRPIRPLASPIDLSAVTDAQHQDHELIVLDVVDNPVVSDANAKLAITATQLQASRRAWISCERLDRSLQAYSDLQVKPPKGLRGSPRDGDSVRHISPGLKPKLFHQVLERNTRLLARVRCGVDVSLVLERLHSTVEELGRHDDCTTTRATRGDLDGLSLRDSDVITLLATELGQGHGSHEPIVQLVQVVLKQAVNVTSRC